MSGRERGILMNKLADLMQVRLPAAAVLLIRKACLLHRQPS